jgi:hypothetical protein
MESRLIQVSLYDLGGFVYFTGLRENLYKEI